MARSVTVEEILRRATKRADQENSQFYSLQDKIDLLNECYPELYDILVASAENYYSATSTISLVSGTQEYALPADFYKLVGVDYLDSGNYIALFPYPEIERNAPFANSSVIPTGTVRIRYIPAPAQFTTADLAESIDGISGWDALIVSMMAQRMLESEESDTTAITRHIDRLLKRITVQSVNRDMGMPSRVGDIYAANYYGIWQNLRYHIYGDQLRFVSTQFLGVMI